MVTAHAIGSRSIASLTRGWAKALGAEPLQAVISVISVRLRGIRLSIDSQLWTLSKLVS